MNDNFSFNGNKVDLSFMRYIIVPRYDFLIAALMGVIVFANRLWVLQQTEIVYIIYLCNFMSVGARTQWVVTTY